MAAPPAPRANTTITASADAVLATALLPQFAALGNGGSLAATWLQQGGELQRNSEALQQQQQEAAEQRRAVMASSVAVTGGLSIGYEKFILDEDQASMAGAYLAGVDTSDNGYALHAMLGGGPGQHFLGAPHTLANFETAFWRSEISNNDSFEQWELDGAKDAATRANAAWKRRLAAYEAPAIDQAVDEELRAWIDARKASFPDSDV